MKITIIALLFAFFAKCVFTDSTVSVPSVSIFAVGANSTSLQFNLTLTGTNTGYYQYVAFGTGSTTNGCTVFIAPQSASTYFLAMAPSFANIFNCFNTANSAAIAGNSILMNITIFEGLCRSTVCPYSCTSISTCTYTSFSAIAAYLLNVSYSASTTAVTASSTPVNLQVQQQTKINTNAILALSSQLGPCGLNVTSTTPLSALTLPVIAIPPQGYASICVRQSFSSVYPFGVVMPAICSGNIIVSIIRNVSNPSAYTSLGDRPCLDGSGLLLVGGAASYLPVYSEADAVVGGFTSFVEFYLPIGLSDFGGSACPTCALSVQLSNLVFTSASSNQTSYGGPSPTPVFDLLHTTADNDQHMDYANVIQYFHSAWVPDVPKSAFRRLGDALHQFVLHDIPVAVSSPLADVPVVSSSTTSTIGIDIVIQQATPWYQDTFAQTLLVVLIVLIGVSLGLVLIFVELKKYKKLHADLHSRYVESVNGEASGLQMKVLNSPLPRDKPKSPAY